MENFKLPPNFDLQSKTAANDWPWWKLMFEDFLVSTGKEQESDKVKVAILRNLLGPDAVKILLTLPGINTEVYSNVIKCIEDYVKPRTNEVFERYVFNKRVQEEGEPFDRYLTSCRQLIKTCHYKNVGNIEDQLLRDKIVHGVRDKGTQETLLRIEDLTLEKAVSICRATEQSRDQVAIMDHDISVNRVQPARGNLSKKSTSEIKSEQRDGKFICRRCKTVHRVRECPAFGKKCTICGIYNHFAVSCYKRNQVNVVTKTNDDDGSEESLFCYMVNYMDKKAAWFENINIEGKNIQCRLDTGADISVIPKSVFNKLEVSSIIRPIPTKTLLEGFDGTKVKPEGYVNLLCKYKEYETYLDFVIVDCKTVLLGNEGCSKLNLIKRVYSIKTSKDSDKERFINENIDIFSGSGKFPNECNIPVSREAEGNICHPSNKLPLSLLSPLKAELQRLEARQAIAKVDQLKENACVNKLVLVEKPNNKLRLCLDPFDLNKYILRKPKVMPTLEDIAARLNNKKCFTVLDLKEGFHHCPLSEDASWKCCFSTPFGVYRYLVLPYGLSNAPELFQDEVEKLFGDIDNVMIWFDDILVMGETEEEHDLALKKLVGRAKKVNAVFNKEKLQYRKKEVKYVGQIFNSKGMQMDPDRVESLVKLKSPENREELQRVLGSFNYVRRYIPDMAEMMSPLFSLLKKNVEWQWLEIHEKAFVKLKEAVAKAPALVTFDPNKKIILQCDASKSGLGCCLIQNDKLVACASRSMNDAELNYSQSEKELLAIQFGTQKFHKYIYGTIVEVHTDHKPLVPIMNKHINKIGSVRLQRLRLKLLKYEIKLVYVPGKKLTFADMLSRSYLNVTERDPEMFEMIHTVSKHLPMSKERKEIFRKETSQDNILNYISEFCYNGWPTQCKVPPQCKSFYPMIDKLYVEAGIVFLENRIVVPDSLKLYVLELVHKGHIGISKCIMKARQLFYWPGMAKDIENYVKSCRTCEKFQSQNYKEEMLPHKIPKLRFDRIGTDILDFAGQYFLIIVDYFSHWLEIISIKNKSSLSVINAMQEVFCRFGFPSVVVADNVPFNSFECREYFKSKEIMLINSTPYHHRSNGMAEKAVGISRKILQKSLDTRTDFRDNLFFYNNAPLSNLKVSPAQILHSRILRSVVPVNSELLKPKIQSNVYNQLCLNQALTNTHNTSPKKGSIF